MRSYLETIRTCVRWRQYDMTAHALEEMAEDLLDLADVERAILEGVLTRSERNDPRGTKHVVTGTAMDQRRVVEVVGRFVESGRFLIITVYEVI